MGSICCFWPRSRDVISLILDEPLNKKDWSFMACGEVKVMGVKARLFRISFSGELGFEVAIPSRYGASLFNVLKLVAEQHGGGIYGMEAMNVMRLEKGFITHAEIDGRATAYDVGMQRMLSQRKDFIGNKMAQRPGLLDPLGPLGGLWCQAPGLGRPSPQAHGPKSISLEC